MEHIVTNCATVSLIIWSVLCKVYSSLCLLQIGCGCSVFVL